VRARLTPQQKYIRGLFCGGTLCDEAMFAALAKFDDVYSNIQPDPAKRLSDITSVKPIPSSTLATTTSPTASRTR
jgi:hypothetical protein